MIKTFRIRLATKLSRKKTAVFNNIGGNLESFYKSVVEHLSVYTPPVPKLKTKEKGATPVVVKPGEVGDENTLLENSDIPSWWNLAQ